MREHIPRTLRWVFITVGVVVLTSITVDATLNGNSISQSALGIFATSITNDVRCPDGMIRLKGELRDVCVDIFEASPADMCPVSDIKNVNLTRKNISDGACIPVSVRGAIPWTFVNTHQARELCAKAGKRLILNSEWYQASLGTSDTEGSNNCNISSAGVAETGNYRDCVSPQGAYDTVGNVWEWVEGDIENGNYNNRELPESGYVVNADGDGVAVKTEINAPSLDFHSDYFWSSGDGNFGMLRGGFHGSEDDAGVFSIQAKTEQSFTGAAIGFRCAQDL